MWRITDNNGTIHSGTEMKKQSNISKYLSLDMLKTIPWEFISFVESINNYDVLINDEFVLGYATEKTYTDYQIYISKFKTELMKNTEKKENFKRKVEELISQIEDVIDEMPAKRYKETESQKICLINELHKFAYAVNGVEDSDFEENK